MRMLLRYPGDCPMSARNIYRALLAETPPERRLYLAFPRRVGEALFAERFGQFIIDRLQIAAADF